jgi:hypothetical protein
MYRVSFSGNDFDSNDWNNRRYFLHLPQSVVDLAAIPDGPKECLRVIIYETGELEMEAVLEFDEKWGCWVARAFHDTIVDQTVPMLPPRY